jgi:hypothetical protein
MNQKLTFEQALLPVDEILDILVKQKNPDVIGFKQEYTIIERNGRTGVITKKEHQQWLIEFTQRVLDKFYQPKQ